MDNAFFNLQIVLDQNKTSYECGELIRGKIILKPKQDLDFQWIQVHLIATLRGKFVTQQKQEQSRILATKTTWRAYQIYEYDFEIIAPPMISFIGKNLEILWEVGISLKLSDEESKRIGNSGFFKRNKPFEEGKAIKLVRGNKQFKIKQGVPEKQAGGFCLMFFFIPFMIAGGVVMSFGELESILFGAFFAGIPAILFLIGLLNGLFFRNIQVHISQINQRAFQLKIDAKGKESKLKGCTFGYIIEEHVEDNRGTSTTTLRKTLYEYVHPKALQNSFGNYCAEFPLPQQEFPPNLINNRQGIQWKVKISKKLLGFIPVKRYFKLDVTFE